jgi:hypothetical protein
MPDYELGWKNVEARARELLTPKPAATREAVRDWFFDHYNAICSNETATFILAALSRFAPDMPEGMTADKIRRLCAENARLQERVSALLHLKEAVSAFFADESADESDLQDAYGEYRAWEKDHPNDPR